VDDTGGVEEYKRIDQCGLKPNRTANLSRGFKRQKGETVPLVSLPTERMSVATNDLSEDSTDVVQQVCGIRWKIEEFHRELKQLTGVEACRRKARLQRNHIGCAMLV